MRANRGTQDVLKDLVDDGIEYASIGIIDSVETSDDLGYLLNITLSRSLREVQARPVFSDTGPAQGAFYPFEAGQEVVVIFPDGDPNLAVAFGGMASRGAALPSSFDNTTPQVTNANGFEVRVAEGESVELVVTESLLADLQGAIDDIVLGLAAIPYTATTASAFSAKLAAGQFKSKSLKTDST